MKTIKNQGFTFTELMVTLSVAAIVLSVGVPGFQTIVQNNRLTTELNQLVSDLHLARMESIKRNEFITMCRRNADGTGCVTTGEWEQGWLVFEDPNRNGVVDAGEEIIQVHSEVDPGLTIKYTPVDSTKNTKSVVTFSSQGFAYEFNGTFTVSDSRGSSYAKSRQISSTGRISIS